MTLKEAARLLFGLFSFGRGDRGTPTHSSGTGVRRWRSCRFVWLRSTRPTGRVFAGALQAGLQQHVKSTNVHNIRYNRIFARPRTFAYPLGVRTGNSCFRKVRDEGHAFLVYALSSRSQIKRRICAWNVAIRLSNNLLDKWGGSDFLGLQTAAPWIGPPSPRHASACGQPTRTTGGADPSSASA